MMWDSKQLLFLLLFVDGIFQCQSLVTEEMSSAHSRGEVLSTLRYHTLNKPLRRVNDSRTIIPQANNHTNIVSRSKESTDYVQGKGEVDYVKEQTQAWIPDEPPKTLPLSIIITASGVAVGIMLFLCIAFYFHNAQLNKRAERFSLTLYVPQEPSLDEKIVEINSSSYLSLIATNEPSSLENKCLPRNNTIPTLNGLPRNTSTQNLNGFPRNTSIQNENGFLPRENSSLNVRNFRDPELLCQQRKSTISLGLPTRGSTLSAYTDLEIAKQSAKRKHSVFIL